MSVKKFVLAAMLAGALAAPAWAETFKIPDYDPIVTIEVPDQGWTASPIGKGIELSDDDDEVYLAIEGTAMKNLPDLVADAISYLAREGVTIDKSTQKETEGKLSGMSFFDVGWQGKDKDKDGDVLVHLTIVAVTDTKGILFTYWASPKGDKQYDADITKMVRSIKKVGR